MMDLKMEVYSQSLVLLGMLEVWESTIWEEKAFSAGSFSVKALVTAESVELLSPENIIWIEGETAGIIEYIDEQAEETGLFITAKGRLLTGLLDRRILWGQYSLNNTVPEIMRYLVNDCCINPTRDDTEARKMPGLVLEDAETPSLRLPDGYTELEYIESSGTQYINTGVISTTKTGVTVDIQLLLFSTYATLFGARATHGNGDLQCSVLFAAENRIKTEWFEGQSGNISSFSGLFERQTIELNKNVLSAFGKTAIVTMPEEEKTLTYPLFILALNNVGSSTNFASLKLYSCQIYDNDVLVRDYIPCTSPSGAVGLYDLVGKSFYGNAGTGEFIAGATVTQTKMTRTVSGEKIRFQKTGGSLLEALEALGETYQVAFGVRFNPAVPRMEFWAREGQNLTTTQNANEPVFYSTELDDVLSSEYTYDSGNYKNVALVGGEGEGDDRTYVTVEDEAYTPPEPPAPIEPTQYTVTLLVDPEGGGVASGGKTVTEGTSITVTATPSSGFEFVEWRENGAVVSTNRNYSFTVSGDRTLTAVFAATIPVYAVVTSIDPAGSGTASGAGSYTEGQTVTVTATPGDGYKFVAWQENGQTVSEDAEYTFTATANRALVAVFAEIAVSRLPEGYTEVEYIESSGTQAIALPTSIFPTSNFFSNRKIEMEAEFLNTTVGTILGTAYRHGSTTTTSRYVSTARLGYNGSGVYFQTYYAKSTTVVPAGSGALAVKDGINKIVLDAKNNIFAVNDTYADSVTVSSLSNRGSNGLFCYYDYYMPASGSITLQPASYITMRLYSLTVHSTADDSNTLLGEFIPCVNSAGIAGLYEMVTGVFYKSDTSTAFIAGPEV